MNENIFPREFPLSFWMKHYPSRTMKMFLWIKKWIIHPNRWIIKKIPRSWIDKDELIEMCIFESMIHFWESENGQEYFYNQFQFDPTFPKKDLEYNEKVYNELLKCYLFAVEWKNQIHDPYIITSQDYKIKETKVLIKIIEYRNKLWI